MIRFDKNFKPLLIYDSPKSFADKDNNSVLGFWQRNGRLDFYQLTTEEKKDGELLDIRMVQTEEFPNDETKEIS